MKIKNITASVLCFGAGLAVPHGVEHQNLHNKRAVVTEHATATKTVTVTDYNAVVWVDSAGKIVKTEYKTKAPATTNSPPSLTPNLSGITTFPMSPVPHQSKPDPTSGKPPKSEPNQSHSSKAKTTSSTKNAPSAPPPHTATTSAIIKGSEGSSHSGEIRGFGVAYDTYTGSYDAARNSACRPSIASDFALLASKGVSMIRTYDGCIPDVINAAAASKLKLMIGLTSFTTVDDFNTKINRMIADVTKTKAGWSVIDTFTVGNELVQNGANAAFIAARVNDARNLLKTKGFTGKVVTVDTWVAMRDNPTICSTSDYCAANAHAYFGGTSADTAAKVVRDAQKAVAAKNGGKRVVITESGWPHAGDAIKLAIASPDNQRKAIGGIIKEFSSTPADMFLFMAFDTKYKTGPEIERNFGIFDSTHYSGSL